MAKGRRVRYASGERKGLGRPLEASVRLLLIAVLVTVYAVPSILVLITSLKSEAEAKSFGFALPSVAQWSNYLTVLSEKAVLRGMINGLLIATGITVLTILVASMAGYVIARRTDPAPRVAYTYLLLGLIVPYAFVPAIALLRFIGIYDSYLSVILVNAAIQVPFTTLLFAGFIQGIPRELDEAAEMDGAGPVRTFFTVILPLLRPVVATNVVLLFTAGWNEFATILYLLPDQMKATVPMSFFQFQGKFTYEYNLVAANLVISLIPVLVLYLFAQRYIIRGMTAGGVKG
ncbi:carbohydrate ABC transporter permease [Devriesea agamarum]|uniref:carbohydrate ABC transporter permease n=1 Tax=Devriesea agamarum TaxID=472569 RepID=UPI00071DD77F|nr:carbohydrate ABC transporter permease [Devriesea agamarum]